MGTSADRTAALVRGIEASVTGESAIIADLYTRDVQGWSPALQISSAAELAVEFEDRDEAFSDIDLAVSPLDTAGNHACVEWVVTVTHTGPIVVEPDLVIEPTGQRISLRGVTVADFDGDRICAFRQYWDEVSLIEQLGLLATE